MKQYILLVLSFLTFSLFTHAQTNEQLKERRKTADAIHEAIIDGDWGKIRQSFPDQDSYNQFLQKMKMLDAKVKLYRRDKNHYFFIDYKAPLLLQTYLCEDAKNHLSFLFQLKIQLVIVGDKTMIENTTVIPVNKIENKTEMLRKLFCDANGYDTTGDEKPEPPKPGK